MDRKGFAQITIIITIVVIGLLAVLRFGIIPNLNKRSISSSCAPTSLASLYDDANLIVIGEAISERVETESFISRGRIYTYTTIGSIDVIRGEFLNPTLDARQSYGCDPITDWMPVRRTSFLECTSSMRSGISTTPHSRWSASSQSRCCRVAKPVTAH